MRYFALFFILVSNLAFSKAVELQTKNPSVKLHSLNEVCSQFNLKHVLLATPKGATRVDCMGSVVSVTDFCKKKYPSDKKLLRGVINFEQKAMCHFADSVIVNLDCSKFPQFCKKSKTGCNLLKGVYATNQMLMHHSLFEDEIFNDGKKLRCYFSFTDQI